MIIILTISDEGRNIISHIYDKHHKRMLYIATQLLGSARGEDAVHDIIVKLLEKFENNAEELVDKPALFFVVLVRNHSLNLLKKVNFELVEFDDEIMKDDDIFQSGTNPEDILLEQDAFERLVALIRLLKTDTRQILENKYILGYTNKDIAHMMGISQTAVSTRIDKAKKKLRAIYLDTEAQKSSGECGNG